MGNLNTVRTQLELVFVSYMELSDEEQYKVMDMVLAMQQRWSRNFGPVVKVDHIMKEVIRNEETKEPFSRVQSQGCA